MAVLLGLINTVPPTIMDAVWEFVYYPFEIVGIF